MILRPKISGFTVWLLTVVLSVSYFVYMGMDQTAQYSSAYNRMTELNCGLKSLSVRRVSQKQFEVIKQGTLKLRLHSAITATAFSSLLQGEIDKQLCRDRLNRDFTIIPGVIQIFDRTLYIRYTVRSAPFRMNCPSLWKLKLFTYGQAIDEGSIWIVVEGV